MDALEIKEVNRLREELDARATTQYVDGSDLALQLQIDRVESDLTDLENSQLDQENRLIVVETELPKKASKTYVDGKDAALQALIDALSAHMGEELYWAKFRGNHFGTQTADTISDLLPFLENYFLKVGTQTGDPSADDLTGFSYDPSTRVLTLTTADETYTITLPEPPSGNTLHHFVAIGSGADEQPQPVKYGHFYLVGERLLVERTGPDGVATSAQLTGPGFAVRLGYTRPYGIDEFKAGVPDMPLATVEEKIDWLFAHYASGGTSNPDAPNTPPSPTGVVVDVHGRVLFDAPAGIEASLFEMEV